MRRRVDWRRRTRHCPPWWPAGEPWPPRTPRWRHHRRGLHPAFWLPALYSIPFLALTATGAIGLVVRALTGAGIPAFGLTPVLVPLGVLALLVLAGALWLLPTRRVFERQERQRRDVMADVAHELRTPLAVMQGRLEGMLDGVYPQDSVQVSQILDETRRLSRLVDDLRTLASSESVTLTLQREPTDLGVLLEDVAASFRPDAARRGATLDVRVAATLPLVDVDPVRIREVVVNLVTNALRFVREGGRVSIDARLQTPARLVVAVTDNGPGISASDLPHVFDRFYKGSASSGSGLGLAIARNLVAAHGGTITAHSTVGEGTVLTFTLPIP